MKAQLSRLALFLLLGSLPVSAAIHALQLASPAIGDSTRVLVVTPTSFDDARDPAYDAVIMLHGWSGDETQWKKDADSQFLADRYDLVLVLPDGGYDGWWLDNQLQPTRQYARYLAEELKPLMIRRYNVSPAGRSWGILGLSMGGYGSLMEAFRHPGDYAAVVSLSGVTDLTRHSDNWGLPEALGDISGQEARWQANTPLHLAAQPAADNFPAVLLICGWDDFAFPENTELFDQMRGSGYSVEFLQAPGAHTHAFWQEHVQRAVLFIVSHMPHR